MDFGRSPSARLANRNVTPNYNLTSITKNNEPVIKTTTLRQVRTDLLARPIQIVKNNK